MYSGTPPIPPPKPLGSSDVSRMSTPIVSQSPRPQPPPPTDPAQAHAGDLHTFTAGPAAQPRVAQPQQIPDPGDQWLPKFLEDKSKQDLAEILSNPALLSALTHAPHTVHPSLQASHEALHAALAENVELAAHLADLEGRLLHQRAATQAQLLTAHALERQWRAKQGQMDVALAPFAPASLYQRLAQGVAEQEGVCYALEESFLETAGGPDGSGAGAGGSSGGDKGGDGVATEREATEWVKRYREAKKLQYLRQERKERWDEGRVGGWR